jgi:hypothetical protein
MGQERPAKRTAVPPEQVFLALGAAWQLVTGTPADRKTIHILHAQSAIETGHWKKMMNFNLGGIKRHGECDWTYFTTGEDFATEEAARKRLASSKPGAEVTWVGPVAGGLFRLSYSGKQPTNCFASWEDLDDGATGYVRLLTSRYPKAIEAAKKGDPVGYVRELKAGKYFTADVNTYSSILGSIVRSYGRKLSNVVLPTVVML